MIRFPRKIPHFLLVMIILAALLLAACGGDDKDDKDSQKTIGVLNLSPGMNPVLDGFKAEMATYGYTEGTDVVYVYDGPAGSVEGLDALVESLKEHDLDLVLAFGTPPAQKAKAAYENTGVPIVFGPVNDVIAAGLVSSVSSHPENLTGIQNGASVAKGMDWLHKSFPEITTVYIPHNPQDASSVASLTSLQDVAPGLGIDLIIREVSSNDELTEALADIPAEAQAVFVLRVAMFDARTADFVDAANAVNIPVVISRSDILETTGATLGFGPDFYKIGQQAAHLAEQILKGTKASDLPVENSEEFLSINLGAATTLGIEIPDSILRQANTVVGLTDE